MPLSDEDFPLYCSGQLIYGRSNHSVVLSAMLPSDAERVTSLLNEMQSIRLKVIANGPTLVGDLTDQGGCCRYLDSNADHIFACRAAGYSVG